MKRYFLIPLMLAFGLASILTGCKKPETDPFAEFEPRLKELPKVVPVTKEETADFKVRYKASFEQPFDHNPTRWHSSQSVHGLGQGAKKTIASRIHQETSFIIFVKDL